MSLLRNGTAAEVVAGALYTWHRGPEMADGATATHATCGAWQIAAPARERGCAGFAAAAMA